MRNRLSPSAVWNLMCEGCNANEIAEYCGVSHTVAVAIMAEAARKQSSGPKRQKLRRAA